MNPSNEISDELWASVRQSYESEAWANAILDAMHHFGDVLRLKSGLQSDGIALVGAALGTKDPKIKLNRLVTESERNIQAGVEQLARGLYQAVRNPRSHERVVDSKVDCDAILVFVDYLLRIIGHSKDAFSIESVIERITDVNYVQNQRYAALLLDEVPASKRLDTLIAIFEEVEQSVLAQRRDFFQGCLTSLNDVDMTQFFNVLSGRLQTSNSDGELRTALRLLDGKQWLMTSEKARLRSENRIVKSADAGLYDVATKRYEGGALATWATPFLNDFSLKAELFRSLSSSLRSQSRKRQDYVFKVFFMYLPTLSSKPSPALVSHINAELARGDERYKNAIETLELFETEEWITSFGDALRAFKPRPLPKQDDFVDDDIPF